MALKIPIEIVARGFNEAAASFGRLNKSVEGISSAFTLARTAVGGFVSVLAARQVIETGSSILDLGARAEAVRESFRVLTQDLGGAEKVLGALKEATRGTVSELRLMGLVNRFRVSGLDVTTDQMAALARAAVTLSRSMTGLGGTQVSAAEAAERLFLGIQKGEPELLDEIGLVTDAQNAFRKYAEAHGKTVSELSKAEKSQATLNFVLDQAEEKAKTLAGANFDLVDSTNRAAASFEDLKAQLASIVATTAGPEIIKTVEGIASAAKSMAPSVKAAAEAVRDFFEAINLLGGVGETAKAVLAEAGVQALTLGGLVADPDEVSRKLGIDDPGRQTERGPLGRLTLREALESGRLGGGTIDIEVLLKDQAGVIRDPETGGPISPADRSALLELLRLQFRDQLDEALQRALDEQLKELDLRMRLAAASSEAVARAFSTSLAGVALAERIRSSGTVGG